MADGREAWGWVAGEREQMGCAEEVCALWAALWDAVSEEGLSSAGHTYNSTLYQVFPAKDNPLGRDYDDFFLLLCTLLWYC